MAETVKRLTVEQEAAILGRVSKATPSPWVDGTDPEERDSVRVCFFRDGKACEWCVALSGDTVDGEHWTPETLGRWHADAAFIAGARQDVPALLAELAAVRAEHKELKDAVLAIPHAAEGAGADRVPYVLRAVNAALDVACGVKRD